MIVANRLTHAAIRVEATGQVYAVAAPGRHHNVIRMVAAAGHEQPISERSPGYTFGFLLEGGLFLDREPAEAHARVDTADDLRRAWPLVERALAGREALAGEIRRRLRL